MRILLVDDQAAFRAAVRAWLSSEPDLVVVGEAHDGQEAVEVAQRLQPDLVLMDINLPTVDGIEAAHRLQLLAPHIKILFLSQLRADEVLFMALKTGARGFVCKPAAPTELLHALRAVERGESHLSPSLAELMRGQGP